MDTIACTQITLSPNWSRWSPISTSLLLNMSVKGGPSPLSDGAELIKAETAYRTANPDIRIGRYISGDIIDEDGDPYFPKAGLPLSGFPLGGPNRIKAAKVDGRPDIRFYGAKDVLRIKPDRSDPKTRRAIIQKKIEALSTRTPFRSDFVFHDNAELQVTGGPDTLQPWLDELKAVSFAVRQSAILNLTGDVSDLTFDDLFLIQFVAQEFRDQNLFLGLCFEGALPKVQTGETTTLTQSQDFNIRYLLNNKVTLVFIDGLSGIDRPSAKIRMAKALRGLFKPSLGPYIAVNFFEPTPAWV